MKIPMPDGPQVNNRPIGTPYSNVDTRVGSLGPAVAQIGQDVDKAWEAQQKGLRDADEIAVAGALAQRDARANARLHGETGNPKLAKGYMESRGVDAASDSVGLMKALKDDDDEFRGKLNERQRALYSQRGEAQRQARLKQVEGHVAREREVAKRDAIAAQVSAGRRAVSNAKPGAEQEEAEGAFWKQLGPSMRELSTSPEDFAEDMRKVRQEVTEDRVKKYLETGAYEAAELLLGQRQKELDPERHEALSKSIRDYRRDQESERIAEQNVNGARDKETGWVDDAAAEKRIDETPPGPMRDQVRERTLRRLQVEIAQRKQDIEKGSARAFAEFNDGGFPAVKNKPWLNKNNPELYYRLKNDAERRLRQSRLDDASLRREQATLNLLARQDFMARPVEERASLDIGMEYAGSGATPTGIGALRVLQREAADAVTKGAAMGETNFVRDGLARADGVVTGKSRLKDLEADLRIKYGDFFRDNKRAPNREEADGMVAESLLKRTVEEPGAWWGTNEVERRGFEVRAKAREAAGKAAAPKPLTAPPPPPASVAPPKPAATGKSTLPPGEYPDKNGVVWVVDEQGNKRVK